MVYSLHLLYLCLYAITVPHGLEFHLIVILQKWQMNVFSNMQM